MTYHVKRIEPETIIHETVTGRIQVGVKTQRHVSYAVVDSDGKIARDGKQFEIYSRKAVAEEVAKWYNGKFPTTENRVRVAEEAEVTRL